jgi:hypothetical protein
MDTDNAAFGIFHIPHLVRVDSWLDNMRVLFLGAIAQVSIV